MSHGDPFGRGPDKTRPKIWASGGQRPPFNLRALGSASLHLSRDAVAPLLAGAARTTRQVAVNVKSGVGRIPEDKLGGAARFVPSHLRVAAWIKNAAAILSHASASADPDVKRGNALVTEIEPHLWDDGLPSAPVAPVTQPTAPPPPPPLQGDVPPVVLTEPVEGRYDPLASIRDKLATEAREAESVKADSRVGPAGPPEPPGSLATTAIQMTGYVIGWALAIIALPYGLIRALWLYAKGTDLRLVGSED